MSARAPEILYPIHSDLFSATLTCPTEKLNLVTFVTQQGGMALTADMIYCFSEIPQLHPSVPSVL